MEKRLCRARNIVKEIVKLTENDCENVEICAHSIYNLRRVVGCRHPTVFPFVISSFHLPSGAPSVLWAVLCCVYHSNYEMK